MPNSKQATKRLRQSKVRNLANRMVKSELKTYTKRVLAAVEARDVAAATTALRAAQAKLDKAAKKGVVHDNAAGDAISLQVAGPVSTGLRTEGRYIHIVQVAGPVECIDRYGRSRERQ